MKKRKFSKIRTIVAFLAVISLSPVYSCQSDDTPEPRPDLTLSSDTALVNEIITLKDKSVATRVELDWGDSTKIDRCPYGSYGPAFGEDYCEFKHSYSKAGTYIVTLRAFVLYQTGWGSDEKVGSKERKIFVLP